MRTVPFNQPINQCTKKWKGKCNFEQNIEKENAIWKVQGSMLDLTVWMGHQLTTCLWINVKLVLDLLRLFLFCHL
jgi:hypothetical protein